MLRNPLPLLQLLPLLRPKKPPLSPSVAQMPLLPLQLNKQLLLPPKLPLPLLLKLLPLRNLSQNPLLS